MTIINEHTPFTNPESRYRPIKVSTRIFVRLTSYGGRKNVRTR